MYIRTLNRTEQINQERSLETDGHRHAGITATDRLLCAGREIDVLCGDLDLVLAEGEAQLGGTVVGENSYALAGIDDDILLLPKEVVRAIQNLKTRVMKNQNPRMHVDEVLVALAVSAESDSNAKLALEQVSKLKNTQVHSVVILSQEDMDIFRRLGIDLTCEPQYESDKLYHK